MEITTEKKDNLMLINLTGKLDSITSPQLEDKLIKMIDEENYNIIFNCINLDYISSAGLRVLLVGAKKVKVKDGKIKLANLKKHIREVFEIAGFTAIFELYESLEEAENSFK
ncbi:MAG: STAS domain-containing protein [Ignavibacteriaceae bacterium]|jgi:anti-anti-sigma factor